MFKGAIIGLGNVALSGHLPAWQRSSEFCIVAGVDSALERLDLFDDRLPHAAKSASLADLPQHLDFVDICTPPHTHYELAAYALERGWNVLCEKPLVLSEEQFLKLRETAAEKGLVLVTVHNWKFAPICRKVVKIVREGALGEIHRCSWNVLRNGPSVAAGSANWRLDPLKAGGGILVDHGWHAFYLILEWFGLRPLRVQASLQNRKYAALEVEDTAVIELEFEGADSHLPAAEILLTWASELRRNSGMIEGTLGRLSIEDDVLRLNRNDGSCEMLRFDSALSIGSHHPDWFEFVVQEFEGELRDDSRRGSNLRIAEQCLRLIERCKAASQAQGPVAI